MYDYEHESSYLDTEKFRLYTVAVCETITERTSVGDIRRAMGEEFKDAWIWDAIAALVGAGAIRHEWGVPSRFTRQELPKQEKKRMNVTPARPADRTKPHMDSIVPGRRVTA